ncbi:TPA: hypothetical protein ACXM54_001265 [Stenotrophomonas maltophilia]
MSDIQRERELRRLEASLGVDRGAEDNSTTEPAPVVPARVVEQTQQVVKKVAEASRRIIKQTTETADGALKGLPIKKSKSLSRKTLIYIYICAGAVLLTGAGMTGVGIITFNLMRDKAGSAAPAPTIAIAPPQGLYIPPVTNQVPGRVQEEERKPDKHSQEAIPQELPLIEETAPIEPVQPPVSSVGEGRGSAESTTPAQTIAPAPAVAPQVRPAKNNSETKVARPPAVVAAPRAIQRHQPAPASEKEIKAEVERVEAGKPWQRRIDQLKELDI